MEAAKAVQHRLSRLIARQGWIGVTIGREYGGMGLGHLAKTIIIEELSRVCGAMGAMVQASQLGVALAPHKARPAQGEHGAARISFGELIFDNCRIPAANRLGDEGDGMAVAYSSSVLYGRANLTAVSLGIHQAIVEETVAYASARMRYGKPIADMPTLKLKIGQMHSRLMTARLAAYHAAYLLDSGQPCDAELINAKLVNVESARECGRRRRQP